MRSLGKKCDIMEPPETECHNQNAVFICSHLVVQLVTVDGRNPKQPPGM